MRPVNLIPREDRSGERRPMRGGPLAYVIVGALAAAVIGVAVLAIASNQISDSKTEIASLKSETAAAEARAESLSAYTQFHALREQRTATVASLADSRFDWQRVMHELALILPSDVWLTNLTGTASPQVTVDGAASVALRTTTTGPALELSGCATSQDAVAGFVQALEEIDGVTRVGVPSSTLGGSEAGGGAASAASGTCQTRDFIASFQMVVAFDAAPVPPAASGEEAVAPEAPPATETTSTGSEEG